MGSGRLEAGFDCQVDPTGLTVQDWSILEIEYRVRPQGMIRSEAGFLNLRTGLDQPISGNLRP